MADVTIQITGLTPLLGKVSGTVLADAVKRLVTQAAVLAENEGKKRSPVDTGRLRASIVHKVAGTSGWAGTNVKYGLYLDQPRTRNPHYRGGPYSGSSTAGWLTEHAFQATARQVQQLTSDEARRIEAAWRQ
jgi:hypothetical protein